MLLASIVLSAQHPSCTDVSSSQLHLKTESGFRSDYLDGGAGRNIGEHLPQSPCSVREVENLSGTEVDQRAEIFQPSTIVPRLAG